jgi:hypothetical protein
MPCLCVIAQAQLSLVLDYLGAKTHAHRLASAALSLLVLFFGADVDTAVLDSDNAPHKDSVPRRQGLNDRRASDR